MSLPCCMLACCAGPADELVMLPGCTDQADVLPFFHAAQTKPKSLPCRIFRNSEIHDTVSHSIIECSLGVAMSVVTFFFEKACARGRC
jgi:hypothetical protein